MTNPVTPNIRLNKIDRTSPSTTYFDLEKYIDQNADTVDRFAGESSEAIGALEKRLDTEERREVILQPGLQNVNAERSAPFKLSGIKGRTLVNLLGRDGNFETLQSPNGNGATLTLDKTNFTSGNSSVKVTSNGNYSNFASIGILISPLIDKTKYYLMALDVKNGDSEEGKLYLELQPNQASLEGNSVTSAHKFETSFIRVSPDEMNGVTTMYLHGYLVGTGGKFAYFDSFRIYEISAEEYTALGSMTPEQVDAEYPYVDSVKPVRNPYAIRYGENLLPPFYEWTPIGITEGSITEPYAAYFKVTNSQNAFYYIDMKLPANTKYTFSAEHNGYLSVTDLIRETTILDNTSAQSATFTNINETTVRIYASNVYSAPINGAYHFKNPMLTLGSTPKPFKPREDSMLALQTDLYANPVIGANADEVFEKDGQYFKLAKWKKLILDGSFPWIRGSQKEAGYQSVYFESDDLNYVTGIGTATKFDGKIIPIKDWHSKTVVDEAAIYPQAGKRIVYLKIRSSDSGWGDNYTPTPDEIKAYFMGWVMYDGSLANGNAGPDSPPGNVYDGTGSKAWCYRSDGVSRTFTGPTATLPTTQAPNWRPYQLVYQLATPTIEPIVSEGMLTFNEGDNQIEVGTGLVLRENVKPSSGLDTYARINDYYASSGSSSILSNKTELITAVFVNGSKDPRWLIGKAEAGTTVNGKSYAYTTVDKYNPSATYSVTYLMLDKSPIVPFTGSYAANEKSVLQELTDSVHQNTSAVSVLMNKKVDKDQPGWITPTLLNGWEPYSDGAEYLGYPTIQYRKDSQGFVHLRGLVKKGASSPSNLFYLPEGYRPNQNVTFVTICYSGTFPEQVTRIRIGTDGAVTYMYGPTLSEPASWLSLNIPPFTLE
ncbi:hypothetical protein AB4124_04855 [Paenibacillus sp. 2KB_20]|uniref:hypothetical protein n=1 Tax=Paenibacillus sp. 2KB_20 TaxID=3232977 RepID=UPI003F979BD0